MSDRAKAKAAAVVRSLPSIRTRRHRTGTAAAAYSHAVAITGDPAVAAQIAVTALRRGAQSRTAVLAHARHLSLQAAASSSSDVPSQEASGDLRSLAGQLAATRQPLERAIVDLELRYGLDQDTFARALGLSGPRATARSIAVAQGWAEALDPAMIAALGPGSCNELRALLDAHQISPVLIQDHTPPHGTPVVAATGTEDVAPEPIAQTTTVASLLRAAPAVGEHATVCDLCEVRLKRMTPVRTLVGQSTPETVPPLVSTAARPARRRLPAALPPSIEPKRLDVYRLKNIAASLAAVLVAAVVIFGGYNAVAGGEDSQEERVERLINEGPRSSLLGTPTVIGPQTQTARLANTSDKQVSWNATSNAGWLTVNPPSGTIEAGQDITLRIDADVPSAGVADGEASVSVVGNDGSRQTLTFRNSN